MNAQSSGYLPVDAMQLGRLTASGFTIPRNNLIVARFACEGSLEMQEFLDSVDAVLQRHSGLRSTFHQVDGSFFQRLHAQRCAELYLVNGVPDVTGPDAGDPFYRKFDLQAGSFLRVRITRANADSPSFFIEFATDHFVADGFSLQIILDDISYYYDCKVNGKQETRPPAAQHIEYARWQRAALTPERTLEVHNAWASELRLDHDEKNGGLSRARNAGSMWNASQITRCLRTDLPDDWVLGLRACANSSRVSTFIAAAAIYGLSLAKAEDSDDATFLIPILGRPLPDYRGVVGNLARTLPIRLVLNPGEHDSLAQSVNRVRRGIIFALTYQDLPVHMIANELSKRPGRYVDCPNRPFFVLNDELRFSLSGLSIREVEAAPIVEAMLPHSTEIKLSGAGAFINTVYDPERASLENLKLLHASIKSTGLASKVA
jgi:hypothetical protein